ncbi:MAG: LysR family transcriptional regulator [Oceanospirillaceae bacterium]|nr:LysR family transcriptional regulator [Oceanospirillaceae bacterium]
MNQININAPQNLLFNNTLSIFLTVCQHKNFSKAAKALNISQASVSQSIIKMEKSLGVSLFDREVRPITLKPEAIMLRDQLAGPYTKLGHTIEAIQSRNMLKPIMRLGVIDSLSANLAPSLIKIFSHQAQNISVLSGISTNLATDLHNREVDIIITSDPFDGEEGLSRYFLFREPHLLVLPKNSKLVGKQLSWQELADYELPLIRYSKRSASGRMTNTHLSRICLQLPSKIEADTNGAVLASVAGGLGWSLTSLACLLQYETLLADLHLQPVPKPDFSRDIYVVTRQDEYLELVDAVITESVKILSSKLLPNMKKIAPWAVDKVILASETSKGKV